MGSKGILRPTASATNGVRFSLSLQGLLGSKPIVFWRALWAASRFPQSPGKRSNVLFDGRWHRVQNRQAVEHLSKVLQSLFWSLSLSLDLIHQRNQTRYSRVCAPRVCVVIVSEAPRAGSKGPSRFPDAEVEFAVDYVNQFLLRFSVQLI